MLPSLAAHALQSVAQTAAGPHAPYPKEVDAHTFLFSSYYKTLSNPHEHDGFADHTFDNKDVPPTRPFVVDSTTGATLSFARLKADSLKVAVNLIETAGPPLPYNPSAKLDATHSSRTTILVHLPNCIAFATVVLGALKAQHTVTPISSLLAPTEIAFILSKARPQVIVTSKGADGQGKVLQALDILAREELPNGVGIQRESIKKYVEDLKKHIADVASSESTARRRIRTVDLAADYLGSGFSSAGQLAAQDPADWTHLLAPSAQGHAALPCGTLDSRDQETRSALLLWSSGTTGLPKGVLLSHRSIIAGCVATWMKPHEAGPWRKGGERWIALAPWCHVFGLCAFFFAGLAQGATLVLPPPGRFNLRTFLTLLSTHRATWANVAPPVIVSLRNTPLLDRNSPEYIADLDLSDLKGLMAGGAPVSPDAIVDVHRRLGKYVQMGYGASETIGTHQGQVLAVDGGDPYACKELGSTGVCLANCEVRIEPPEHLTSDERAALHKEYQKEADAKRRRKEYAPSECCVPGEVWIRTPARMMGYYTGVGSDEGSSIIDHSNKPFTSEGWYRSGDEGVLDAAGNLWIIGRTKETFKVKGFQVAPVELDSLFSTHPAVADAAAGHVFEDAEGSDFPVLYIAPKDPKVLQGSSQEQQESQTALVHELSEWVRGRLAYYKWPRYFVFTPTIPRSPAGKILRKDLHRVQGQRHRAPQSKSKL